MAIPPADQPLEFDPASLFPFPLDNFQREAIAQLNEGKSVVVCAPTGSGKTVIAEYAVELALRNNKRCFYTTPLKALSNQKFNDFKHKYSDSHVGLLTGDISINRDAPIVVMTTEVFRNMLYGTALGEVSRNLRDVASVILDECHYMNDAERGTVWEESIIYCPHDIQIVALSATVANAAELTRWIDQTHGPTALVESDFRPVPLRFYYFGKSKLYPLLLDGNRVNSSLKGIFGKKTNRFDKKARHSFREQLPDPREVLLTLHSRKMLPAIIFLFSRRGCEESMRKCISCDLVTDMERSIIRKEAASILGENQNLLTHPHLEYLYEGLAVHHAGMLPSWKVLVEKLFQKGLIKAVFATETLAAGINMPARTTVISAISKRSDNGHRSLTASEFLQMSGRAGRRGMDEVGHVVILRHPFESVEDAGKLATASPDPLYSRFTPSYGMVLNLLQRYSGAEARDLIERSFGQFEIAEQLEPWYLQKMAWETELASLSKPLCPKELGNLSTYRKLQEKHQNKLRQLRSLQRGSKPAVKAHLQPEIQETAETITHELNEALHEAESMPCFNCPVINPCGKQQDRIRFLENKLKELNRKLDKQASRYWKTFDALSNILRLEGYLNGDTVTDIGKFAAALRATNELFIAEVVLGKVLDTLSDTESAALLTAIISEDDRNDDLSSAVASPKVDIALQKVKKIGRKVFLRQRDFDIDIPVEFSLTFSGLSQMWAEGASWEEMRHATYFDEGIVVRAIRRTIDLSRQIRSAPNVPARAAEIAANVEKLLSRDEVKEDY